MENEELLQNKPAWKKHIKEQINLKIIETSREKIDIMTKLRHQKQQNYTMQSYIQETSVWRVRDLIKVKLELLDIGRNYGQDRLCSGCKINSETTEHIIVCREARELVGGGCPGNLDEMSDKKNLLHLYNYLSTYIQRRDTINQDETCGSSWQDTSRSSDEDQ
jgi:hypothetical protein